MPHVAAIDAILAAGVVGTDYRVLTCDLAWPAGEPPYLDGASVQAPAIPTGDVPVYDAGAFDASAWTDCTGLVRDYTCTQNLDQQCDVLSLTVAAGWGSTALDPLFRAMRAICLQQRLFSAEADTGWFTLHFGLSCGYSARWEAESGAQIWTVNALDALGLAGLDVLGSATGSTVYQPDLVEVGGTAEDARYAMPLVATAADAWEYAVTSDDQANGPIHPNWADRPAPSFWCHNVPGASAPVPLALAGEAVQAVFGEGRVRVGTQWARESPGNPPNYTGGLGFSGEAVPDIRCHLYRFAHPAISDGGQTVPSDVSEALTILTHTADTLTVDADCRAYPPGLTLTLLDGSARRYQTAGAVTTDGHTTFTLTRAIDAAITDGVTRCRYGEANRATDVVYRLLTEAGYQTTDAARPLYAAYPETPELDGAALPIILPPLVYAVRDNVTRLEALEEWRRQYAVLPSWFTRATADGRIVTHSIRQLFDDAAGPHPDILPLSAVTAAEVDRTDQRVYTRVWVEGRRRQVTDWTQEAGVALTEPTIGGLPAVTNHQVVIGGDTQTLRGSATRAAGWGDDYAFPLADLLNRGRAATTAGKALRPWAWYWRPTYATQAQAADYVHYFRTALVDAWRGKTLLELDLGAARSIGGLELRLDNPWWTDTQDWGGNRHNAPVLFLEPRATYGLTAHHVANGEAWPQRLTVEYYDDDRQSWQPLAANLEGAISLPQTLALTAEQFDTRAAVTTARLRLVCDAPFYAHCGLADENAFHGVIGVFLSQLKVFSGETLAGTAELGVTAPFTGDGWQAARDRLRRRTYVVPDVADWAQTQAQVDALARDWLFDVTRNLSPTPVACLRPDARVGDTVRVYLPTGEAQSYGDDGLLTDWRLHGVELRNSDGLVHYWSLSWAEGHPTLALYADAARTRQVAHGTRTGAGVLALTGPGLSGTVTVAAGGAQTGTVGPPTYLVTDAEHSAQMARLVLVNYVAGGV